VRTVTPGWRVVAAAVLAAWVAVLGTGLLPGGRSRAALVGLIGTWAAALAAVALLLGRRGFTAAWAIALGLVALAATAGLYDRAVLLPSLDAAARRLEAAEDHGKWRSDHDFLARMAAVGRVVSLLAVAGALLGVLLA